MNKTKFYTKYAVSRALHTLALTGEAAAYVVASALRGLWELLYLAFLALWNVSSRLRRDGLRTAKAGIAASRNDITGTISALRKWFSDILRAKKDGRKLSYYIIGGKEHTGVLPLFLNIVFFAGAAVFAVFIIGKYAGGTYALKLTIGDDYYGYIANEQVCSDAINIVNTRVSTLGGDVTKISNIKPVITLTRLDDKPADMTKFQIADEIIKNSGYSIQFGYGFYINDKFYGAVTSKALIETTLADIISENETRTKRLYGDDVYIKFADDISADNPGFYLSDSMVDAQSIVNRITGYKQVDSYYTVKDGDSPLLICDKVDITQAEMEKLNPGFSTKVLHGGDKLLIRAAKPILPVSVVVETATTESIPFDTEYKTDDTLPKGETKVDTEGEAGENRVEQLITYTDEVETSRETVNVTRTKDPVTKIVLTGSAEVDSDTGTPTIAGKPFIRPIAPGVGYYSTYFSAAHRGIDIGCAEGTPIRAMADGVVALSGSYYTDYGKCVIIRHGNGLRTLYAHCSALAVTAGQHVTAGQIIGYVGATGKADGNHLHFEVLGNGNDKYDPLGYIG